MSKIRDEERPGKTEIAYTMTFPATTKPSDFVFAGEVRALVQMNLSWLNFTDINSSCVRPQHVSCFHTELPLQKILAQDYHFNRP